MNLYDILSIYPITSDKINEHWLNIIIAVITIFSAVLALFSIYGVLKELRRDKILQKSKVALFEDLIRHFWINNVITSIVRDELEKDSTAIPEEGIFRRMHVLDTDLDFNGMQIVSRPSPFAHQCELKMRNYNVSTESTYKAICDEQVPLETKLCMLDDLMFRSCGIIKRLYEVARSEGVCLRSKEELIAEKYDREEKEISEETEALTQDTPELHRIFADQKKRKINNKTVQFIK